MPIRSLLAVALFLSACSHAPAPVVAETPEPEPEETGLTLNGDEDQAFLDQSLELAMAPWNRERVASDLRSFIELRAPGGVWEISDPYRQKPRKLTLKAIRSERLLTLADGSASVCVEFVDEGGDRIDLDFSIDRSDDGAAERINGFEIHKVNGRARYSYLEKEGAWVRSAKKGSNDL
jgi:hypothetical protein